MRKRIIAIHLPQFHPFKENDEWWGKGFTEWTNVVKARPRFKGHYQPHLPSDTGFYDMRLPETRQMQAVMAEEYGIYGFCYYHYWFNGKQLMERPVNDILALKKPEFPFMLCWANENWTRNWDGMSKEVLIEQKYCDEDDKNHISWLCKHVFSDSRYIRIDNKPVFAVYRIELFPDFKRTSAIWRQVAKEEFGMDLYLINAISPFSSISNNSLQDYGLDASFDFQPRFHGNKDIIKRKHGFLYKAIHKLPLIGNISSLANWVDNQPVLVDYPSYVDWMKKVELPPYKCYPCVSPSWDNSPRRVNNTFWAFTNSEPTIFGEWLKDALSRFIPYSEEENLVFINAWNEWAEGNHLEPDQKWGRAYLEEVKKAIENDTSL